MQPEAVLNRIILLKGNGDKASSTFTLFLISGLILYLFSDEIRLEISLDLQQHGISHSSGRSRQVLTAVLM